MKQIAHTPPRPPLPKPRPRDLAIVPCSSGGKPLNEQGECACCTD